MLGPRKQTFDLPQSEDEIPRDYFVAPIKFGSDPIERLAMHPWWTSSRIEHVGHLSETSEPALKLDRAPIRPLGVGLISAGVREVVARPALETPGSPVEHPTSLETG